MDVVDYDDAYGVVVDGGDVLVEVDRNYHMEEDENNSHAAVVVVHSSALVVGSHHSRH